MWETWEVGNREKVETGVSKPGHSLMASRSDNPSGRSESAITEVPTPCVRLRVLPSLAARTSQCSSVSTGPCSRCGQRSVTFGYVAFRLCTASDRDEPCSPVPRRGLMPTEPRTVTQRFRGDGRVLTCLVEVCRDFTVIPDTGECLLLARNAVTPRGGGL